MRAGRLLPALLLPALLAPVAVRAADTASAEGEAVYKRTCSVCHQTGGVGLPGSFPKLAGRAARLAAGADGRQLMVSAVLFGMAGKLELDGQTIMGVMPPQPRLTDVEVAQVLTYVAALEGGRTAPFTPAEVASVRAGPHLSPTAVNSMARALKGGR